MKLKAVIIDDERNSIDIIHLNIVHNHNEILIVGETTEPEEGVKQIKETMPDLVFLDIEMPGMNGFELLEHFPSRNFEVIFITAYDNFAIQAFRVHAIDYLLKPIETGSLTQAIVKVKARIANKDGSQLQKIKDLFNELYHTNNRKIIIQRNEGVDYIPVNNILRVEADRNYSIIFMDNGEKIMISKTLSDIDLELNDKFFFRSHKSHIINLHKVKRASARDFGVIIMQDNSIAKLSRRKKEEFDDKMNQFI